MYSGSSQVLREAYTWNRLLSCQQLHRHKDFLQRFGPAIPAPRTPPPPRWLNHNGCTCLLADWTLRPAPGSGGSSLCMKLRPELWPLCAGLGGQEAGARKATTSLTLSHPSVLTLPRPARGCAHTWQHQNRERTEVTGKHRGAVTGLPSLRVIVLRFIQVAACARASFLLWLSNTSRRGEAVLYPFIRGVHLLANVKKHCYEHSCTSIHVDTLSLFNTYIFLEEMSMLILCPY